jgi:hypothetical protein
LNKERTNNTISVFPNPTTGLLTIQLNTNDEMNLIKTVNIYDVMGRKVYFSSVNQKIAVLNLSSYPKGIYFIETNDSENGYNQKISVQ